jgi:hypothetical protein
MPVSAAAGVCALQIIAKSSVTHITFFIILSSFSCSATYQRSGVTSITWIHSP